MSQTALLVAKQLRELRWVLSACLVMLALFLGLASYLYGTFGDVAMRDLTRISPQLLSGLLGGLSVGFDPLSTWLATLLAHPLMLTLLVAATVAIASRGLAGEIDRGTMDLLLAAPISRRRVVIANALVLQLSLITLVVVAGLAIRIGLAIAEIAPPSATAAFLWALVNLWALFSAIAGAGLLASALCDLQGRALAFAVSFVVVSFFVNLVASLWAPARFWDVFSVFRYYQPHPLLRQAEPPWSDLAILLGVALVAHGAALLIFERRDIAGP